MIRTRTLLVFLVIVVVALILAAGWGRDQRVASAERRLASSATEPVTAANPAALALEDLAAKLDVGLAPTRSSRPHRENAEGGAPSKVREWVNAWLTRSGPAIEPPPPEVQGYLDAHAADLDALIRAANEGSAPSWDSAPYEPMSEALVNVTGHVRLHEVIAARALDATRRGDVEAAKRALEASWRLNQALLPATETIGHFVATQIAKLQAGLLRKLDAPLPEWAARLSPGPYLDARAAAFPRVAKGLIEAARGPDRQRLADWFLDRDAAAYRFHADQAAAPLLRLWAADAAVRLLDLPDEMTAAGLCRADADAIERSLRDRLKFNPMAADLVAGEVQPWLRTGRVALDLELTSLVLRWKDHRRAHPQAAWNPEAVRAALGDLKCTACPERSWALEARPGNFSVELKEAPAWSPPSGLLLPLRYDETGVAAPAPAPEVAPAPAAEAAPAPTPTPR